MRDLESWQWDHTLPAVLSSVDPVVRDLRYHLAGCCSPSFRFDAELILREAMTNAIEHGCACNPELRVRCVARHRPRRLLLAVWDEGAGFDWRQDKPPHSGPDATRGRGLAILKQYSDAVRYNAAGNGVVLIKREMFTLDCEAKEPGQMQTNVERLDDRVIVQPAEDLAGAGVAELRRMLRDIAATCSGELVMDLRQVRMIDSSGIGLLVAAHNSLRRQGGRLAVVHASEDILHLMRSMRIHQHFSVSGD